jgi:hypothetical protein
MKKINMLIILILSIGLMLTACGSGEEDNNYSIYVPPALGSFESNQPGGHVGTECVPETEVCDYLDNNCDGEIDEGCTPNFVAVGNDGIIVHSYYGTVWAVNDSQLGTGKNLMDVASGSWVAVGYYGNAGFVIKSDDAKSLQTTDLLSDGIASLEGIASDGIGTWFAVGRNNISEGIIATSDDGINWTIEFPLDTEQYKDVTYGDGKFVAVGRDAAGNGVLRSSLDDWTDNQVESGDLVGIRLDNVAYDGNDKWFAIGSVLSNDDTVIIEFNSDWTILSEVPISDIDLNGIASDGSGKLVAVGEDDTGAGIAVTFDGDWSDIIKDEDAESTAKALKSVVYGNGSWLAVGMNGIIGTIDISTHPSSTMSIIQSDTDKTLNAIAVKP